MNVGGGFLPRLNICLRPISYKYREGKVKRTLKRESNRARNYDDGNLCSLRKWKQRRLSLSGEGVCCDVAGTQLCFQVISTPFRGGSALFRGILSRVQSK